MAQEYVKKVADAIIEQLKEGAAPWIRPWQPGETYLPYNPTSGKTYHGINSLWLMTKASDRGYKDTRWMTFKQALDQGACVKKGEKGTQIQFWQWQGEQLVIDDQGQPVLDKNGEQLKETFRYERPRIFSATVFNAEQIEGLPPEPKLTLPEWQRHELAEQILSSSGAAINHVSGNRAFYNIRDDAIILPERTQFESADNYYATALHELGHWTGHESRLNRDLLHPFGSDEYAREELRAEIASLMLGEQLGIGHDPGQHAAYIQSWIRVIEDDPRTIFRAAAEADKIAGFVLGLQEQQQIQADVKQQTAEIQPEQPIQADVKTQQPAETQTEPQTEPQLEQISIEQKQKSRIRTAARSVVNKVGSLFSLTPTEPDVSVQEEPVNRILGIPLPESDAEIYTIEDGSNVVLEPSSSLDEKYQIRVEQVTEDSVRYALELAKERFGDTPLVIEGSGDFKYQLVTAAIKYGIPVEFDDPQLEDIRQSAKVKKTPLMEDVEESDSEELAPVETAPIPSKQESEGTKQIAPKTAIGNAQHGRVYQGKLVDHGAAPYNHDPENKMSYYVTLETSKGNKTIWSLDFERAIKESNSKRGDQVLLEFVGEQEVVVNKPVKDEHGRILGEEQINALRNTWNVENLDSRLSDHADSLPVLVEPDTSINTPLIRTELAVPYTEKNAAKAAGAKWDKDAKRWYAPAGVDLALLAKWIPKANEIPNPVMQITTRNVYLSVPQSEQDAAKAAGAQWDQEAKSWYVPSGVNFFQFSRWAQQKSNNINNQIEQASPIPWKNESIPFTNAETPKHPVMQMTTRNVYLSVPYTEKDEAKAAGARWDKKAKAWYVPPGVDFMPFSRWTTPPSQSRVAVNPDPRAEFAEALKKAGLKLEGPPQMDGKLIRVAVVDDKPGEKSGSYLGHLDGHPAGYIENFKTGLKTSWKSSVRNSRLGTKDLARLAKEAEQRLNEREAARDKIQEGVAQRAAEIWGKAILAQNHPYLESKGITGNGARIVDLPVLSIDKDDREVAKKMGAKWDLASSQWYASLDADHALLKYKSKPECNIQALLVPAQDSSGKIWNLQTIMPDGTKSFFKGGAVQERYFTILPDVRSANSDKAIIIAEGYSTAVTVAKATGLPTLAAFHAGNLEYVAQEIRNLHPDKMICIAADNDHQREAKGKPNVGKSKAEEAAKIVGGHVLLPRFVKGASGSDWNDLAKLVSKDFVSAQLKGALEQHFKAKSGQQKAETKRQISCAKVISRA